jgi:hypothetical protein
MTSRLSGAAYTTRIPTLCRDFNYGPRDLPTSDADRVGNCRDQSTP